MRFLFFSSRGDMLSTAERVQAEGNDVELFVEQAPEGSILGRGIVPVVDEVSLKPDTVIVFDAPGQGRLADSLRKEGWPVIGASDFADRQEIDKRSAQALMRMAAIDTPLTKAFTDVNEARQFVRSRPEFLVFKPNNSIGIAQTKVFSKPEKMAKFLEKLDGKWTNRVDFILQEQAGGLNMSLEGWFNGNDWIFGSLNSSMGERAFLNGGLGTTTESSGATTWFYKHARPAIAKQTLFKMTRYLKQVNYTGPISVNTRGGKVLSFTPRFNPETWATTMELIQGDIGKLLSDVARHQPRRLHTSFDFAIGVRLSIPPYPVRGATTALEAIRGREVDIPMEVRASFHPRDLAVTADGLVAAGSDGYLGTMTHTAGRLNGLNQVYKKISTLGCEELQYRTDVLAYRALRDIPEALKLVSQEEETAQEKALRIEIQAVAPPKEDTSHETPIADSRLVADTTGAAASSASSNTGDHNS